MESQVENYRKEQIIIGANYSEYPQPLRGLLEHRKAVYLYKYNLPNVEILDEYINYCEDKIKLILAL